MNENLIKLRHYAGEALRKLGYQRHKEPAPDQDEVRELEEAKARYAGFDKDHVWAFIAGHSSQDFRGNPKYLFVYINRYRPDIAAYWLCSDEDTIAQVRELGFTAHKLETPAAQYAIDRTGVLVEEQVKAALPEGFENVKYLNLWHGVGAKRIERKYYAKGREVGPARKYIDYNAFYRDHQILTVTSPTIEKEFREDCGVDEDKVLRTGYLRCEYQQNFEPIHSFDSDLRKIKGIPEDTALAVYAPTYRATGEARFNTAFPDLEKLYQCCERNHILLIFKMHPWMESEQDFVKAKELYGDRPYFWFWDNRDDFYEIIDQMDLVIIDYSSMLSDFVAAGVPHYIRYIYDFEEYIAENMIQEGEYFDRTIGYISRSFDELLTGIDTYQERNDTAEFQRIHDTMWAYAGGKDDFEKTISRIMDFQIEPREFKTLYSFDIFDTLISRKVLDPMGIFAMVQDRIAEEGGFPPIFSRNYIQIRHSAERNVREFYQKTTDIRNTDQVEISYREIFDRIADVYRLSEEQKQLLADWEMEAELDSVVPLEEQVDLVKKLLNDGETVVLISDMYLPKEFVKKLLYKADPELADLPLFLSSEYGVQKVSQKLFYEVYSSFEPFYDFEKWIHYGDEPTVDITPARNFKISARRVQKPEFNEMQQEMVQSLGTGDAYLVAALQARLCAESSFKKDEFVISFVALTMVPYIDWVLRDAISRGYRTLYFVSRDGYHLKRIADEIIRVRGLDFQTKYIYASRRTWRIPSYIDEVDKDFWLSYGNFSDVTTKEKLLEAMDLDEETFRCLFPTIDPDAIDFSDRKTYGSLRGIFQDSAAYNAYLLAKAAEERPLVEDYLRQEIDFNESFAFVEYYGRGYTQDNLVSLMKDINGQMQVPFYYERTILPTMGDAIRHHFTTDDTKPYFMESIFANIPYKSIEAYEREKDGKIVPVITPIEYDKDLYDSMERLLPVFAARYAALDLCHPEDTDRMLHAFSYDYYMNNRDNPFFMDTIGPLKDSVSLYGTKREFAPAYTDENIDQFANKEIQRGSLRLTTDVTMSVARSDEKVRDRYSELYQILPGDDVEEGRVLTEIELENSRKFKEKYENLMSEAKVFKKAYDLAVQSSSVQNKAVIVLSGRSFGSSGLDLVEEALRVRAQEKLEISVISMRALMSTPDKIVEELASARFVLVSAPIEQFCQIRFRPETKEILLSNLPFFLYHQGMSADYFLKWQARYKHLASKNDFAVLQVPSGPMEKRFRKDFTENAEADCSLLGCCNTDLYFRENAAEDARKELLKLFPEAEGKKIILYMPTVRQRKNCPDWISMINLEVLRDLIGEEYAVVANFNASQLNEVYLNTIEIPGFSKMLNTELSIRQMLLAADFIVGDYRDTLYESALLHKPVYFTVSDRETFFKQRNFAEVNDFDDFIFGPVVATAQDLADQLRKVESYDYGPMEKFRSTMLTYCDGHSAERVAEYLIKDL